MQQHDMSNASAVETLNSLLTATQDVLANCDMILAVINTQLLQIDAEKNARGDSNAPDSDSQQLSLLISLLQKAEMESTPSARKYRRVSPARLTALVAKQRCNTPKKRRLGASTRS